MVLAGLEIKCLISQQHFTGCNYGLVTSQLSVLASHKTNFESVAQGALELELFQIRKCNFFLQICVKISVVNGPVSP